MASHTSERRQLAKLPSGIPVKTTIHSYVGETDGPSVYIQAAQHGREINGTAVLRRIHPWLLETDLAGEVVTVPVADPLTFDHASYTTPEVLDSVHANMNRVWPGDTEGSLHERMAAALWTEIEDADVVVDLHTGGRDMASHVVFERDATDCRELAEAFGTDLLLAEAAGDDADSEWHERDFSGKLRVAAREAGIPAITPELAHNKAIVEAAVETGVTGVKNVLRSVGVVPSESVTANGEAVLAENHLGRVTAGHSGLFRPAPELTVGQAIGEGTPLGTVYDPTTFDTLQEPVADRDGVLYALNREARVVSGDRLASVAERR